LQPEFVAPANTFTIKKIKNNTNNHNINNRNNISNNNNNNNITNNNNNNNYETFLKTTLSRSPRENLLAVRRWSFTPSISGRRTRSRPRWPRPRRIRRRKVSAEPSKDLRPSFSRQTPSSTTTTESGLTDTTLKSWQLDIKYIFFVKYIGSFYHYEINSFGFINQWVRGNFLIISNFPPFPSSYSSRRKKLKISDVKFKFCTDFQNNCFNIFFSLIHKFTD